MDSISKPHRSRGRDETIGGAVVRVLEAGQKLIVDRIDLTRLELTETFARATSRAAVLVVAGSVGLVGWIALMGALAVWLAAHVPLAAALLVVAAVNAVAAGALLLSQVRRPTPVKVPDARVEAPRPEAAPVRGELQQLALPR